MLSDRADVWMWRCLRLSAWLRFGAYFLIRLPPSSLPLRVGSLGGRMDSEQVLKSAGTLLLQVQAPPPAPWPDEGPESLRSSW
ncbi:hypothetical protein PoB_001621100 [Plakobranchus ocellatus]|uniref:Uncharacterized protein n=1 Tax=Plakobranchus ocellatus TaxID=259542 RepID=A0AAV3YRE7_9GAST|nr:hypothetical protein PoB_001621100 [Plakobranchus ocellatus]